MFIGLSGLIGYALGQTETNPLTACTESFSENDVDVFVSAYSYDPKSQLESGGAFLTDPLAPRTATAHATMTFPVADERFGGGGLANSKERKVRVRISTGYIDPPPADVTVHFKDIDAATAEALKNQNLECRLALDGKVLPEVQILKFEYSQYDLKWSASCGTVDPDRTLGLVDIGIVDADSREPIYRGRFATHVRPATLQRIGEAIANTSLNARTGLCDTN